MCALFVVGTTHLALRPLASPWPTLRLCAASAGILLLLANATIRIVLQPPSAHDGTPFTYPPGNSSFGAAMAAMGTVALIGLAPSKAVRRAAISWWRPSAAVSGS
jgi:hypothetical protein